MKIYGREKKDIAQAFKKGEVAISVYGIGKMGLPLALLFAEAGARVIGVGRNPKAIEELNNAGTDINEPGLQELLERNVRNKRFVATTDPIKAGRESDVKVILVPTFLDEQDNPDLEPVKTTSESIAKGLQKGDFVILESTAPPGTTDGIIKPILEKSGLKAGVDFGLAHCPERTSSGRAIRDISGAYPKIVGGVDERSTETAEAIYLLINRTGVIAVKDAKTAEAVKVFEGIYRDVNIALANQLALVCDELGIDAVEAIKAANTQPYSNIHMPGPGVGGHCIGVYPYFITKKVKTDTSLIKVARDLNDYMARYTVNLVVKALHEAKIKVGDAKVVVLGVAFRGGVKETRKSPSLPIIKMLNEIGADVYAYDPLYSEKEIADMGFKYKPNLDGADCAVLLTDHKEFKSYDWKKIGGKMRNKIVVDGRQIVDPKEMRSIGFIYKGIGYV